MSRAEELLNELEMEARTTVRVLERVPEGKLDRRPHPRSRTLGQLALHIALVPGAIAELAVQPSPAQVPNVPEASPATAAELVPTLKDSIARARRALSAVDDGALDRPLRLMAGDRELMTLTPGARLRSVMLNDWYHHRGQLSVY